MKKLLVTALVLIVLAGAGFGAYRLGWIGRFTSATTPGGSATTAAPTPALDSPGAIVSMESVAQAVDALQASSGALATVLAGADPGRTPPVDAAARLDRLLKAIDTIDREALECEVDPAAMARRLGPDARSAFEWVRDATAWVPYPGLLRGAAGVLMDRTGNSLDRSLLLAAMLRAGGHTVRLARAALTEEEARTLWPRVTARAPALGASADVAAAVNRTFDDYIKGVGADAGTVEGLLLRRQTSYSSMLQAFGRETDSHVARIRAVLGTIPASPAAPDRQDLEALRDHWWVQRQAGDAWEDLDPLEPGSRPGSTVRSAERTVEAQAVPPQLRHRVRMRVVIERLRDGRLEEQAVLDKVFAPADTWGRRVALYHIPVGWPREFEARQGEPADARTARFSAAIQSQKLWILALAVGSETASVMVDDGGRVVPPKGESLTRGLGVMSGALAGEEAPEGASELTAEWIEYELMIPGQPSRTIRRPCFDLVGPARRAANQPPAALTEADRAARSWALLGEVETLAQFSRPSPAATLHLLVREMLSRRDRLVAAVRDGKPDVFAREVADIERLSGPLHTLAAGRWQWCGHAGGDAFLDHPNVFTLRTGIRSTGSQLVVTAALDLADNRVGVRPGARDRAFLVALQQGVCDTNAERLVLGGGQPLGSTLDVFDEGAKASGGPRLVRAGDQQLAALSIDQDVRARLEADLAGGFIAIVPTAPVSINDAKRIGWWRVRPGTGETVGVMDDGLHEAVIERAMLEAKIAAVLGVPWIMRMADIANARSLQLAMLLKRFDLATLNKIDDLIDAVRVYCEGGRCL
jgi:hypothetical protein